MKDRIDVTCPCCRTKLVVEAKSGEILSEKRPKMDADKTFEDAMSTVKSGAAKREDAFSKAFERTNRMDDLLEKKFEEARKKAEDDKGRPSNPLDFD
jgi:hypothetical protein